MIIEVQGFKSVSKLAVRPSAIPTVVSVHTADVNLPSE